MHGIEDPRLYQKLGEKIDNLYVRAPWNETWHSLLTRLQVMKRQIGRIIYFMIPGIYMRKDLDSWEFIYWITGVLL